ncbi:MAG: hypothetical protein KAQ94_06590 [Arcobacteraceae bacterium]|nr:hypothetical protein [Arcobacteraceae bacterium]
MGFLKNIKTKEVYFKSSQSASDDTRNKKGKWIKTYHQRNLISETNHLKAQYS